MVLTSLSLTARVVCVYRPHSFEGLAPGSQYTVDVISISGERRGKPGTITLHTGKSKIYLLCVLTCVYLVENVEREKGIKEGFLFFVSSWLQS